MQPQTVNNLKPCKCCGSKRVILKSRVAYNTFYYVCKSCGYSPEIAHSLDEAVEKWNDDREADR
jgi:hypothetical protein